ncbi:hypothetical protein [Halomontanus rarus]|uniref:hypothetical protein n=1 Tax=Halomontanus rarus TaxID=3034020 RepID=UPI001A99917B
MSATLSVRSLTRESLAVGSILLGWYVLGGALALLNNANFLGQLGEYARAGAILTGTAIAALYVLVRSVSLADSFSDRGAREESVSSVLREGLVLAPVILFWFLLAGAATILRPSGPPNIAVETFVLAFTRTGVATASLYLLGRTIALARPAIDRGSRTVPAED